MIAAYRHTNLEHLLTVYFEYMTNVNEALFAKGVNKKVDVHEKSDKEQE